MIKDKYVPAGGTDHKISISGHSHLAGRLLLTDADGDRFLGSG